MDIGQRTACLESLIAAVVSDYPSIWLATISARILTNGRIVDMPIQPHGIAFEKVRLRRALCCASIL